MGEAQVRDLWWRITKIKGQQGWCQPIQSCTATLDIGREDPWFLLPIAREVFPFPFYWYNIYIYILWFIYIYILCINIYIYTNMYIYIYSDVNGTIARKFPQHLNWPGISWLCWAAVAILLGLQSSESSWRTSVFRGELCLGSGTPTVESCEIYGLQLVNGQKPKLEVPTLHKDQKAYVRGYISKIWHYVPLRSKQ